MAEVNSGRAAQSTACRNIPKVLLTGKELILLASRRGRAGESMVFFSTKNQGQAGGYALGLRVGRMGTVVGGGGCN